MDTGMLVLIPPILVLILALVTRNVTVSLLIGIFSAGLIATNFHPLDALLKVAVRLINETGIPDVINQTGSYDKIVMFGFLIFLGIFIELLTHTGGLRYYTHALSKRIHTKRQAQITSLLLSCCFFVDDYFNALMVGSIMRPITDYFRIPRAKLAYLLNAMTSPLSVIIPASSWVGMMLTQFEAAGVTRTLTPESMITIDPFHLYLNTIPFLFYPMLSIMAAWFIVSRDISYGLMHKFEMQAMTTGNLFGGKPPIGSLPEQLTRSGSAMDVFLPLITFISLFLITILYTGDFTGFGGSQSFFNTFMAGNNILALFIASGVSAFVGGISCLIKRQLTFKQLMKLCPKGYLLMQSSILILWLAWTFSTLLESDLHTGQYIAPLLLKTVNVSLVPLIVFLVSTIISACTGSSWGTISFLTPVAMPLMANLVGHPPLAESYGILLGPVIAAVISGAVAGCQLSPVTDATVMASTSAVSYHVDHAQTQASYSIAPLLGATIAFLCSGLFFRHSYLFATVVPIAIGFLCCVSFIYLRKATRK